MFICGSGSFGHKDDDESYNSSKSEGYSSPVQTPKRSKTQSFCKILGKDNSNKNPFADSGLDNSPVQTPKRSKRQSFYKILGKDNSSKNPFSDRGLDKFNALLADHDNKKQQIYSKINPEEISFVRFTYTNDSKDPKPIVVRVKDKIDQVEYSPRPNTTFVEQLVTSKSAPSKVSEKVQISNSDELVQISDQALQPVEKIVMRKRNLRCNTSFSMENLKRPQIYLPVMVLMILMFLAISGRVFSILCTSIGWFVIPTVIGGRSNSTSLSNERKPKRKKEYVKILSEKKIVKRSEGPSSPTSVLVNTLTDDRNQRMSNRRN